MASLKVFCVCRQPDDHIRLMIACDGPCKDWYHYDCVGLNQQSVDQMTDDKYLCPNCLSASNYKRKQVLIQIGKSPRKIKKRKITDDEEKQDGKCESTTAECDTKLYCLCQQPYSNLRSMIGCDFCQGWFHYECVGLREGLVNKLPNYQCPSCVSSPEHNNLLILNLGTVATFLNLHEFSQLMQVSHSFRNHLKRQHLKEVFKQLCMKVDWLELDLGIDVHLYHSSSGLSKNQPTLLYTLGFTYNALSV